MFVSVSCAIAFAAAELGLRIYLEYRNPANFQQPSQSSTFLFFRDFAWTYDHEVGYRYKPDQVWMGGLVQNGRLLGCNSQSRTDARGNMGSSGAGYDDAEVKVLVFGDLVYGAARRQRDLPAAARARAIGAPRRRVSWLP